MAGSGHGWLWPLLMYLVVAFLVYRLIHYYANPKVRRWVKVTVSISWVLCFSIVALIPLDISQTFHRLCVEAEDPNCPSNYSEVSEVTLSVMWRFLYWSTFWLCWLILPLIQSYVEAGDFTVKERWKTAVKENVLLYSVMGLLGIGFIIYLIVAKDLDIDNVQGVCIALANLWAMFLLVTLMGYGLVEVPRKLWIMSNRENDMNHIYFHANAVLENYDSAKHELKDTVGKAKRYSDVLPQSSSLRQYVDQIMETLPPDAEAARSLSEPTPNPLEYKHLVALHKDTIRHSLAYERSESRWNELLDRFAELELIEKERAMHLTTQHFDSLLCPPDDYLCSPQAKMAWHWKVRAKPLFYKILAFVTIGMSSFILFLEVTAWTNWRFFSLGNDEKDYPNSIDDISVQFLASIPLIYTCICTFFSIFKLKVFNVWELHSNQQTDGPSLLFNAAILCRLVAPLGYNLMQIVHVQKSTFGELYGQMNVVPVLGDKFNVYFPIAIVVFCLLTAGNCFGRCISMLGLKNFAFEDTFDQQLVDEGRRLLEREREYRKRNLLKRHSSGSASNGRSCLGRLFGQHDPSHLHTNNSYNELQPLTHA